jgi:hypothetical protein
MSLSLCFSGLQDAVQICKEHINDDESVIQRRGTDHYRFLEQKERMHSSQPLPQSHGQGAGGLGGDRLSVGGLDGTRVVLYFDKETLGGKGFPEIRNNVIQLYDELKPMFQNFGNQHIQKRVFVRGFDGVTFSCMFFHVFSIIFDIRVCGYVVSFLYIFLYDRQRVCQSKKERL